MRKRNRTYTLRTQLILLMTALVLLQSFALASALSISQVFQTLDAESYRLFNSTANARTQSFNSNIGLLVANIAEESRNIGDVFNKIAVRERVGESDLHLGDEYYGEIANAGTEVLLQLLRGNSITGAFFILNGSNTDKNDPSARSAVYIRNTTPGINASGTDNYIMEVGPIATSQEYRIATSINWNLDITLDEGSGKAYEILERPQWAAVEYPKAETERYGYCSPPLWILTDRQQAIFYSFPILGGDGAPFGVIGVEISLAHFTKYYLPNTDLPYQNSFYAIAPMRDGQLDLEWVIPSGPLASVYLQSGNILTLTAVGDGELYETYVENLGQMYCFAEPLDVYSKNSPFYSQNWTLVGFVPQSTLHETSDSVRIILIMSIILTTFAAFLAILCMVYFYTKRIANLSSYISSLSPNQDVAFVRTGMREIDDLTGAVSELNKSVRNASKTASKILELTLMPIGGFDETVKPGFVTVTEYIGRLLHLGSKVEITKEDWDRHYARLTAHPAYEYENTYQFMDNLSGELRWLRIMTAQLEGGMVGVIQDATHDIEEHRRLAYEVDYDALTHLYNRIAFKREAFRRIDESPDAIGAMIFCDLDNLKYVNDSFGHEMGDRLLTKAGEMFSVFMKYGALVSRISGDEFAIYIHGFKSIEDGRKLIEEQYAGLEPYSIKMPDGSSLRIRFSSGIAWYPQDSNNVTDLLKLSDFAMYEAKHNRKGSVFEFNRKSYQENAYLLEKQEAINHLLDEELIRFAYQPITDLRTGEIFAYEFLMRPLTPNFKSPLEILTVAGAQSKLGQLERLVIFNALKTVRMHEAQLRGAYFFVNSIPSQVLSDRDHAFLAGEYSDLFNRFVIEVTEAENNSPQILLDKVRTLREFGIKLALDDYGSGYSNEVRILSVTPDIVKVDIAMIQGIHYDKDKQLLIKNLLSFCHPKNISVIAEGVEDFEDLAMLSSLGIDYVQGFYVARPSFTFEDIPAHIKAEIRSLYASNFPKDED